MPAAPTPPDAVVLVGHGGVPRDYPRDRLARLKALEGKRRARGAAPDAEEATLEAELRDWPRTDATDPYRAGLQRLAARLQPRLGRAALRLAYNEFCAPTLEQAVADLVAGGARAIVVLPSMLTPGGVHSEQEIPETIAALRRTHPDLDLRYVWPFDLDAVAELLAGHALGSTS